MTDWKKIAEALDPPVPAADIDKIVPVLSALETALRPLILSIPPGTDVWTPPVEPAQ